MKKIEFLRVSNDDTGENYFVDKKECSIIVNDLASMDVGDKRIIEKVEMSQKEFEKLPEFEGF